MTRRRYTAEFKAHAVELVNAGRAVKELAQELGIGVDLIYNWVREAKARVSAQTQSQGQGTQSGNDGPGAARTPGWPWRTPF